MHLSQDCTLDRPRLVLTARTAADLMTARPASLLERATAREAAVFLTQRGVSAAPVINEAGGPVGVLSQTDLVVHDGEEMDAQAIRRACTEDFGDVAAGTIEARDLWQDVAAEPVDDQARVRDLMTPTVFTVRLDAPAAQVVEDMLALRVHRLFVVDESGVLVGVITATDVLRHLAPEADAA
jgi:CBS domain-containing protein